MPCHRYAKGFKDISTGVAFGSVDPHLGQVTRALSGLPYALHA